MPRRVASSATTIAPIGVGVDPARPCLVFRVDGDRVERGVDGELTTVYERATDVPTEAVTLAGPVFSGSSTVDVYDTTGSGGMTRGLEDGRRWETGSGGMVVVADPAGIAQGATVSALAFARRPAEVGYALVASPLITLLYRTTDGGASWTPVAPPTNTLTTLAVDPLHPDHVYSAGCTTATWTLYESGDGGGSWTSRGAQIAAGCPVQLVIVPAEDSGGTVHVIGVAPKGTGGQSAVIASDDDGTTWRTVTPGYAVTQDPSDLARVVIAVAQPFVSGVSVLASTDALRSFIGRTIPAPGNGPLTSVGLEVDDRGDVFVDLQTEASDELTVLDVAPGAAGVTAIGAPGQPLVPGGAAPWSPSPPAYPGVDAVRECVLPGMASASGALEFDGTYLDYSDDESNLILRIDPRTCQPGLPIHIDVAETGGVAQPLTAFTYDPEYVFADGERGAILARGSGDGGATVAVYAVTRSGARVELAMRYPVSFRVLALPFLGIFAIRADRDPTAFVYDSALHALWVSSQLVERFPTTRGGQGIPATTCMGDLQTPAWQSAWAAAGDHVMYVQLEDDSTVDRVDTRTCTVIDGFVHPRYSEGTDENDQMACDGITFAGTTDPVTQITLGAVLWIRDIAADTVRAYPIPGGSCAHRDGAPAHIPPAAVAAALLPPFQAPPEPQPAPRPDTAYAESPAQAEVQAQLQSQAHTQAQTQANAQAQVGTMPERQRQVRVAVAAVPVPAQNAARAPSLLAARSMLQLQGAAVVVAGGLLLLACLSLRGAPATATARRWTDLRRRS